MPAAAVRIEAEQISCTECSRRPNARTSTAIATIGVDAGKQSGLVRGQLLNRITEQNVHAAGTYNPDRDQRTPRAHTGQGVI